MFRDYDSSVRRQLKEQITEPDKQKLLNRHRIMLERIQRERLIHLIVTVFVGLAMTAVSIAVIVSKITLLVILCVPLMILFFAYIIHYRYLENTAQSWYRIEDTLLTHLP